MRLGLQDALDQAGVRCWPMVMARWQYGLLPCASALGSLLFSSSMVVILIIAALEFLIN